MCPAGGRATWGRRTRTGAAPAQRSGRADLRERVERTPGREHAHHTAFAQAGLAPPRIALHTDGLIDTIAFVAGSDALALMPEALWRSGLLEGRLTVLPLADPLPSYDVVLFRRREAPLTPAAEALVTQFMREAAYRQREQRA